MKVRITKQEDGTRAYYVMSGDRRNPVTLGLSGVAPENRKSAIADLISQVAVRMRPGGKGPELV